MSVVDKVIAAVTPPESDDDRANARAKARAAATPGDWLSLVLDHHEQIESAIAETESAQSADAQLMAMQRLATLVTGHANAEETVLYPALAKAGHKGQASMAYTEQATTKMQLAELERLEPLSQEFIDKLGHIKGALLHHMYEEEGTWFMEMKTTVPEAEEAMVLARFREEFERYMGGAGGGQATTNAPMGYETSLS